MGVKEIVSNVSDFSCIFEPNCLLVSFFVSLVLERVGRERGQERAREKAWFTTTGKKQAR